MQLVGGADPVVYWLSNFLFDYSMNMASSVLIAVTIALSTTEAISNKWYLLLMALALYSWANLGFVYAFQFLFSSPSTGASMIIVFNGITGVIGLPIFYVVRFMAKFIDALKEFEEYIGILFRCLFPMFNISNCFMSISDNYRNLESCKDGCTEENSLCCSYDKCFKACLERDENYLAWAYPGIGKELVAMIVQGAVCFGFVFVVDFNLFEKLW
ncbi:hypothetical protein EGW08_001546 [Elysia chlorotica]|uniref:ABC-2 type transporter transmembrane domain-containing protein n=1 Tax=Elysia chlorotica TaxID=188477 RepID=A0A3S1AFS3_ELYCH|nr:hypothetical protein EGW08_001546 [Elysia chlorotica]